MAKVDYAALPGLRATVKRELDGLPKFNWEARNEYDSALAAARLRLEKAGFDIKDDWRGAAVKAAGVRATATGGVSSCLNNWYAAAGRALDKQAIAGMAG